MLGMVFTELIEMVETRFSPDMADAILSDACPADGGAYTAVGYYDHAELVRLVQALSARSGLAVPDLVQAFGKHLLGRFTALYPAMFTQRANLFDFLAAIDGHIHVEVRKLYSQAHLPRFEVLQRDERNMHLLYQSPRSMEPLAQGLIEGAAALYGQACRIDVAAPPPGRSGTVFRICLAD
jgi:hypothetical protein